MNKDYSNINIKSNYHLERLSKYLNYKFSSGGLFGLSFILGAVFILFSMAGISVTTLLLIILIPVLLLLLIFTFNLVIALVKERKYVWIIFFFCFAVLPLIAVFVFLPKPVLMLITLAPFFIYCFTLKSAVNNWIRERKFRMQSLD
jgi:hypothetical protein